MYRTILLPLDGSALAERAVSYANVLAQASGARLLLLQAIHTAMGQYSNPIQQPVQTLHAARAYLAGVAARLDRRVIVETAVFPAGAAEAIRRETHVRSVDLIVMTPYSHPGRGLYGRVAAPIVRGTKVPVLLIPTAGASAWPQGRRPRMLVPLDGCGCSGVVLRYADDLAAALRAEVLLLRVVAPAQGAGTSTSVPPHAQGSQGYAGSGAIMMGAHSGGQAVSMPDAVDDADTTMATIALAHGADVVALPTHACGSVPQQESEREIVELLQHAGIPLLLVNAATGRSVARTSPAASTRLATGSVGR